MADSKSPEQSAEQDVAAASEQAETTNDHPVINFKYPQIALNASFNDLLHNSVPVLPETPSNQDASSTVNTGLKTNMDVDGQSRHSLSDSWDTFDHTGLHNTDDDLNSESTDTESLVDVRSTADTHSLEDEEFSDEDGHSDDDNFTLEGRFGSQGTIIIAADRPAVEDDIDEGNKIVFTPHKQDFVDVYSHSHSLGLLDGTHIFTAKMRLSDTHPLTASDLNVLYFNPSSQTSCAEQVKFNILQKISDALLASWESHTAATHVEPRGYSIIPREFGPGAPPLAELAPFRHSIIVQECLTVKAIGKDGHGAIVLKDGKTVHVKGGCNEVYHSTDRSGNPSGRPWPKPDLIVFCADHQSSHVCNDLMDIGARLHIPLLPIHTNPGLGNYPLLEIHPELLHVCIEDSTITDGDPDVQRVPIDLDTFMSIDPRQLSQHIACMQQDHVKIHQKPLKVVREGSQQRVWKTVHYGGLPLQSTLSILCLLLAVTAFVFRTAVPLMNLPATVNVTALETTMIALPTVTPSATTVPQPPALLRLPSLSQLPTLPRLPALPQLPAFPQFPSTPQQPSVPQQPLAVAVPEKIETGQADSVLQQFHDLAKQRPPRKTNVQTVLHSVEKLGAMVHEARASSHALVEKTRSDLAVQVQNAHVDLAAQMQKAKADLAAQMQMVKADFAVQIQKAQANLASRMQEVRDLVPVINTSAVYEQFRASVKSPTLSRAQFNAQQIVAKAGEAARREQELWRSRENGIRAERVLTVW